MQKIQTASFRLLLPITMCLLVRLLLKSPLNVQFLVLLFRPLDDKKLLVMFAHQKSVFKFRPSCPRRFEDEEIVRNGLAVTPAQALELTKQGISISSLNSSSSRSFVGESSKDWDVPAEFRRGVDALADGYQMQQDARGRLRSLIKKEVIDNQQKGVTT